MIKQRLNIPAVLIHTVNNRRFRVDGTILSINESANTCSMRFKGNMIQKNIPLNKVLINEGFLDKIKEYGKKITNFIVKKVKGFIGLIDEATGKLAEWSKQNVANLAIMAAKGQLPRGVYFAPSKSLQNKAGVGGMTIDDIDAIAEGNDIKSINKFWTRVIKRAGTNNETISESVSYVNKRYYKLNPLYKELKKRKKLNEAIYALDNPKWGKNADESLYGRTVNAHKLQVLLFNNFTDQLKGKPGQHKSGINPYLIWGAPGIGKTAIVIQTIKRMASHPKHPINLNLQYIQLNLFTQESWSLPKDLSGFRSDTVWVDSFTDSPPAWLPVYQDSGNIDINIERDNFYNSCQYLAPPKSDSKDKNVVITSDDGRAYEGGIIFFDEFSRRQPGVDRPIMNLISENSFGANYKLASKWGFVFAANRAMDDSGSALEGENENEIYNMPEAIKDRFNFCTYVPSKEDWLKWAKTVNANTGESKVLPFIIEFIEATDEKVWYSTIMNGGYDDKFDRSEIDSIKRSHEMDDGKSKVAEILDKPELQINRKATPRTWARISNQFKEFIINALSYNSEGLTGEEYYQQLVKQSTIEKRDKSGKTYKEYYGGILPDILIDALNEIDDDDWEIWLDDQGGLEELDPTGTLNRGKKARYNLVYSKFVDIISEYTKDTVEPEISQNPAITSWKAFNNYAKSFTPENIESIWETGSVLSQYQKDDDKSSNFQDTINSKWKANSSLILEVLEKVQNNYPGDIESDMEEDMQRIKAAKNMSADEVSEEAKRLNDLYSFKYNGKTLKLLFDKDVMNNPEALKYRVQILLNSKVAQRFTHLASWIAKISLQVGQHKYCNDFSMFIQETSSASKTSILFANKNATTKAMNEFKADRSNKAAEAKYIIETSKNPFIGAYTIMTLAKKVDFQASSKRG